MPAWITAAMRAPRRVVGQVFNLRRIVNPPAALGRAPHGHGESPTGFAACRYVKPAPELYRPAEVNLLRETPAKPAGRWAGRTASASKSWSGRWWAGLPRAGNRTPERVIALQTRIPHGRQRNPFDKRSCPALWLERAFLDRDLPGLMLLAPPQADLFSGA
jgi:hypothetical protein